MHSAWIELDSRGRLSDIKQWTENASSRLKRFVQVFHFTVHRWWWWRSCLRRDCDVSQINYMYAQYVKNTMQSLNIADVTKDQRFPWTVGVTSSLSFKFLPRVPLSKSHSCVPTMFLWQGENPDHTSNQIKSLLCTPIRNAKKDKVIGTMASLFTFWWTSKNTLISGLDQQVVVDLPCKAAGS